MPERISRFWPLGAFALMVLGLLTIGAGRCSRERQAGAAQVLADQHHGASVVHADQGVLHDQQAEAQQPQLAQDAIEVAHLRGEVARLRAGYPRPDPPASPQNPAPDPVPAPVDLAPLVAKQDELIQAQDRHIRDLHGQVHTVTLARDSWRAAAGDSAAEAVQLRAVIAAKDGIEKAALWRGRIQGFAVGAGSGFIAGRFR